MTQEKERPISEDADRVRLLQTSLWTIGYMPGRVDGVYGPRTILAVREFQRDCALRPTGAVDEETWAELAQQFVDESADTQPATPHANRRCQDTPVRMPRVVKKG